MEDEELTRLKYRILKVGLLDLQDEGRGYSTIHALKGIVKPTFEMAVNDDLIRKNSFNFPISTVVVNNSTTREALTEKQ